MAELWPHQAAGIDAVCGAIFRGRQRVALCSPTGGGKSRIVCELIDQWAKRGLRTVLYTNRRMLADQLSSVLDAHGIKHGVRAAGHDDERHLPVQVSSIQTEDKRVLKKSYGAWELHPADRVVIDEAHVNTGATAVEILRRHCAAGAAVLGVTATPIGLGDLYEELVQAGTNSELRACGALVPAVHYGCDEPDWKRLKKRPAEGEEFSENEAKSLMMTPGIFGRVIGHYRTLNPEGKPTILFAPGVAESLWFAEQFYAAGIPAAHLDGEDVWINGRMQKTSSAAREEALEASRCGDVRVLCNRYVLREGIDAPWLAHGILATCFGSVQSYLQSGGRLLRSHPSLESVTIQDHGGNWWRHGSLNADRRWLLGMTPGMAVGLRADRLREGKDTEPFLCPGCGRVLTTRACPGCGHEVTRIKRSRPVVQADGSLKQMVGDIFRPHPVTDRDDGPKLWKRMYWRSRTAKGSRTFKAAMALFAAESNWQWPDKAWPFMPVDEIDFWREVIDVPMDRLIPEGAHANV